MKKFWCFVAWAITMVELLTSITYTFCDISNVSLRLVFCVSMIISYSFVCYSKSYLTYHSTDNAMPGSCLDVRQTGIQETVGLILQSSNILLWRLVVKSLIWPFSPYPWFKRKDLQWVIVNRLGLSLPWKTVVRLTDPLNMTTVVDCDVKQQNNQLTKQCQ